MRIFYALKKLLCPDDILPAANSNTYHNGLIPLCRKRFEKLLNLKFIQDMNKPHPE
jgi:hypothetical protein